LNDRLIRTRQLPRANAPQNEERITRYFYDAMGRELGRLDAEGYLLEHNYDLAGNRTRSVAYSSVVAPNLREATLGQMRPATTAQDRVTLWFFDGRGNTLAMLDAEGYLTQYLRNERLAQDTTRAFETRLTGLTGTETLATLLSRVQAGGVRETRRGYDALGRLSVQTDTQGTVARNTYDAQGNLVRTELAGDTSEVREGRLRYNVFGELIGELDGEGTTRLRPDMTQAQIDAVFAQYGTRHGYDGLGRRIESIDADGHKTWYFYDADGRPTYTVRGLPGTTGVLNARGEVSQVRYSAFGDAIETTAYTGVLTIAVPGDRDSVAGALTTLAYTAASDSRRTYAYNRRGQLTGATDAESASTRYSYDGYGDRVREERLIGANVALRIDSVYDRRGLLTSRDDAVGSAVARHLSWAYDAFGQTVQSTDARGAIVRFGYDRRGRQITRTQTVSGRDEIVATAYDAFDRVLSELDASGRRTRYVYDTAARSMQVISDENVSVTTVYNRFGQQQTVTQSLPGGRSAISEFQYDRNGRLLSAMDTLRNESRSEYDARGLLSQISVTEGEGTATPRKIGYEYDALGRRTREIVDPGGLGLTTDYVYDANDNLIRRYVADTVFTYRSYYDQANRPIYSVDPNGAVTRHWYDAAGREVATRAYLNPIAVSSLSDATSIAQLDALVAASAGDQGGFQVYDRDGRVRFVIDLQNRVSERRYDAAGRLAAELRYAGTLALSAQLLDRLRLGTATAAEIAGLTGALPGSDTRVVRHVYDDAGRERYTLVQDGAATLTVSERRYDESGRVLAELSYGVRIAIGTGDDVFAVGNALAAAGGADNSRRSHYVYDRAGRMRYSVDDAGAVTGNEYDEAGRLTLVRRYDGL
ncbi:MAG: RHS repeat protein, partial [Lysobacter sp.]|nr:RHS repeat protein [Lysobacter sp.]